MKILIYKSVKRRLQRKLNKIKTSLLLSQMRNCKSENFDTHIVISKLVKSACIIAKNDPDFAVVALSSSFFKILPDSREINQEIARLIIEHIDAAGKSDPSAAYEALYTASIYTPPESAERRSISNAMRRLSKTLIPSVITLLSLTVC